MAGFSLELYGHQNEIVERYTVPAGKTLTCKFFLDSRSTSTLVVGVNVGGNHIYLKSLSSSDNMLTEPIVLKGGDKILADTDVYGQVYFLVTGYLE